MNTTGTPIPQDADSTNLMPIWIGLSVMGILLSGSIILYIIYRRRIKAESDPRAYRPAHE